jgi:hypothetical protein
MGTWNKSVSESKRTLKRLEDAGKIAKERSIYRERIANGIYELILLLISS